MDDLRLFGGVIQAPSFLPAADVARCKTYREAVRLSWAHRRSKFMTKSKLAEHTGCYPSHVSDYLHADDRTGRRDLPAERLDAWAATVGNWGVHQWLAQQVKLTFMEEVIAQRAA